MPRYKILIEYDGTDFAGWQRQKHSLTIQGEIDKAIFKFTHEKVEVYGSGRTDAGVHARGQVAHFDLAQKFPDQTIIKATNYHLRPNKIVLLDCEEVAQEFHARFSARQRIYKYRILNRSGAATIDLNRVWHVREKLNVTLMQKAAESLEGLHDFTSLKTADCQAKTYLRTIDYIKISKEQDYITIEIAAPSFIHNMVRNFVGMLKLVGNQSWTSDDITALLEAKDPTSRKLTAPACGLYLEKIEF